MTELMDKKRLQKYVVGENETITGVSVKFNMSVSAFRKLNKLSMGDHIYTGQTVQVYVPDEKKELSVSSNTARKISQKKNFEPLIVSLRKKYDRHYVQESEFTLHTPTFVQGSISPIAVTRGGFSKEFIPPQFKQKESKIYQDNIRYVVDHSSVLGIITITPQRIIFEPNLEEPEVKDFGLLQCQFSCVPSEVKDARILTLSPYERDKLGIGGPETSFPDSQFLQLTILDPKLQSSDDAQPVYKFAYFILNEVDAPMLNDILDSVFTGGVYYPNADQISSRKEKFGFALLGQFSESDDEAYQTYMPTLNEKSKILNEEDIKTIVSYLPQQSQLKDWKFLFSTALHGISMNTFYRNTADHFPVILLVEDTHGGKFGAFLSEPLEKKSNFFGTGECFLFVTAPLDERRAFYWTQKDELFMLCTDHEIAVGGGGGNYGLWVGNDFTSGTTNKCQTFNNEKLSRQHKFKIVVVEVWAVE